MTAKQAPVLLVYDKRLETPALAAVSALGVANTGYGADFARQLKRQRGLRVVMFVAADLHQPQLLEALALLRQRYRSALPACLCFCGETLYQQFMAVLQSGSTQEREQLQQQLLMQQQEADLDFILDDVFALVADSREGLERVCDIVKNLRAFARKDDIEMAPVNVCQILTATLKLVKHQLNAGIEVVNHVDAGAQVSGSAGMLGQVFLNLIQNAIHVMADGGQLEIASSTAGQRLLLSFSDHGSGMPADVVTRIFDPFFTTKEVGKGTGPGLSTVYGIVKKHQGDIQVSSEPGVGTRFELSLPLCP
ncbi:sensor histidine kinase [Bacterioplanoides pacificum]|uniref:histidine kinase n=1 Tax=Bacterioplanoides pacificum TaxID=1171596 RepID=A0ABV7VRK5_9GAMM